MLLARKELFAGVSAFVVFLVLVVSFSYMFPHSTEQAGYTVISISRLEDDPFPMEGVNISSSATIIQIDDSGTSTVAEIGEDTVLVFAASVGSPGVGDRILLRGVSWVATNGSITVHQFNVIDPNSSLVRSVPGIVVFALLFLVTYTVDGGRMAFVRRSEKGA